MAGQEKGIFEDVDLSEPAFERGFHTDEEMFKITGATSLRIVKSLQNRGLLSLNKFKVPQGRWRRAWTDDDLYKVALTIDMSEYSGLSIEAAADLLVMIPKTLWKSCLELGAMDDEFQALRHLVITTPEAMAETSDSQRPSSLDASSIRRKDRLKILLADRCWVYAVRYQGGAPEKEARLLGRLPSVEEEAPAAEVRQDIEPVESLEWRSRSLLHLYVSRMGLRPLLERLNLPYDIDY